MSKTLRFCLLTLVLVFAGCGDDSASVVGTSKSRNANETEGQLSNVDPADETGAAKFVEKLKQRFDSDMAKLKSKVDSLVSEEEKATAFLQEDPEPEYVANLMEVASAFTATDTGYKAALEAVSRTKGNIHNDAMTLLITKFASKLDYRKVINSLHKEIPSQHIEDWFRLMIEFAPNEESKPWAMMGFVKFVDQIPAFRDGFEKNPHLLAKLPESQQTYLRSNRIEELKPELLEHLELVESQYADARYDRGRTFGEAARSRIYEMNHLEIGMVAPEIVGEDLDGMEFKLSDYRGKVVMLDFWGHWCGPCRSMYPQERAMVEQLASAPFALIGMNSDYTKKIAREAVESEGLSWRHFWNGPKGTQGPIARQWNVEAWPTVYLIDGDGVIRYKDILGEDLDRAIEKLLGEAGHEVSLDL